ncbi:MAG: PilZ domain-containing protein [Candidatus Omnitrophica bacterium]|nr:PilZ domain-containing protein [Candidatus Omnitrophota bacterium]
MAERRRYVRVGDTVKLKYRILKGALKTASLTHDISEGGVRLPAFQKLEPGTILELKIALSEFKKPVVVVGRVVWCRWRREKDFRFLVGVKFIRVASEHRSQIISYLLDVLSENKK